MPRFFSINEFMQQVEYALELENAYEETHDESLLEAEIELWQRLLPEPIFKHMPQDFQALAYGKAGQSMVLHWKRTRRTDSKSDAWIVSLWSREYAARRSDLPEQ
jgi:hypothetical protein